MNFLLSMNAFHVHITSASKLWKRTDKWTFFTQLVRRGSGNATEWHSFPSPDSKRGKHNVRSVWYKLIKWWQNVFLQKGSPQQPSNCLSWTVHPLLFFFFCHNIQLAIYKYIKKNDNLETENRFYDPFITQGTLQEFFFSHFSLFCLFSFFKSSCPKIHREWHNPSRKKTNVLLKSLMSPLWNKILPRRLRLAVKHHRKVRWRGEGALLIVVWASTETCPLRCLALGLGLILQERWDLAR